MQAGTIKFNYKDLRLLLTCFIVSIVYAFFYYIQYTPPQLHLFAITIIYISAVPQYIFHPINFVFGFHILWYTFPLMYAARYSDNIWTTREEIVSFCMLITTYIIAYITLHFTTKVDLKKSANVKLNLLDIVRIFPIKWIQYVTLILTLAICFLLQYQKGFFNFDPSQHTYNREGTGVLTVLLIFFSGIALSTAGYTRYKKSNGIFVLLFYLFIIAIILMFLQHRSRLLFYLILLTIDQSFYLRMKLKTIFLTGCVAFSSFMFATMLRAYSMFETSEKALFFILNYFDTYDMLVLSVRDFPPAVTFKTTFMAFNKFITPIGNTEGVYYHMSYWLTQKYFGDSGSIGYRTSIQWPLETDMYISFAYVFGIPLIALYFFIVGYVYKLSLTSRSLGAMYVSVVLNLHIFSHLRGALITFVDIYLIPLMFISYYLLNKARFEK